MNAVQRFVGDGDQLLHEISAPGASNALPELMESDNPSGKYEDRLSYHGRVAYTHGPGINAPLSLVRVGYSDVIPGPVQVSPGGSSRLTVRATA